MATVVNIKRNDPFAGFQQAFDTSRKIKAQSTAQEQALVNALALEKEKAQIAANTKIAENARIVGLVNKANEGVPSVEALTAELLSGSNSSSPHREEALGQKAQNTVTRLTQEKNTALLELNLTDRYLGNQLGGDVGKTVTETFGSNAVVSKKEISSIIGAKATLAGTRKIDAETEGIPLKDELVRTQIGQIKASTHLTRAQELLAKSKTMPEGHAKEMAEFETKLQFKLAENAGANAEVAKIRATTAGTQAELAKQTFEFNKVNDRKKRALLRDQMKLSRLKIEEGKRNLEFSAYKMLEQQKLSGIKYDTAKLAYQTKVETSGSNKDYVDFLKTALKSSGSYSKYYTNAAGVPDDTKLTALAQTLATDKDKSKMMQFILTDNETEMFVNPETFNMETKTLQANLSDGSVSGIMKPGFISFKKLAPVLKFFKDASIDKVVARENETIRRSIVGLTKNKKIAGEIIAHPVIGPMMHDYALGSTGEEIRKQSASIYYSNTEGGLQLTRIEPNDRIQFESFYSTSLGQVMKGITDIYANGDLSTEVLDSIPSYQQTRDGLTKTIRKAFGDLGSSGLSDKVYAKNAKALLAELLTDNTFLSNTLGEMGVVDERVTRPILNSKIQPVKKKTFGNNEQPETDPSSPTMLGPPGQVIHKLLNSKRVTADQLYMRASFGENIPGQDPAKMAAFNGSMQRIAQTYIDQDHPEWADDIFEIIDNVDVLHVNGIYASAEFYNLQRAQQQAPNKTPAAPAAGRGESR